jgi:uncharacterized membrane protein YdbT with pleckstrin-like domain
MSRINKQLSENEHIIYFCRISRLAFLGEYLLFILVAIISLTSILTTIMSAVQKSSILASIAIVIFYAFLILSLVLLVRVEYKIWSVRYALTNHRVIISEGIFTEKFKSAMYDKITDIGLTQSFWDKVLNIGTLNIDTAGSDDIEIIFNKISRPIEIKNKISGMQSKSKEIQAEEPQTNKTIKQVKPSAQHRIRK